MRGSTTVGPAAAGAAPHPTAGGAPRRIVKASDVTLRVRREEPAVPAVDVEALVAEAAEAAAGEGYRAGYEDGFSAGALQAGAVLADAVERLNATVAVELAKLQANVTIRREEEATRLVDLAFVVAEWAARRELTSVPAAFFGRLEELLADRDRRAPVEIAVHADLLPATRAWSPDPELRVVASSGLEPGECRVTIGDATVFATFADAFGRARAALDALPPLEVTAAGIRIAADRPEDLADDVDDTFVEELSEELTAELSAGFLDDEVVEVLYDVQDDAGGAW